MVIGCDAGVVVLNTHHLHSRLVLDNIDLFSSIPYALRMDYFVVHSNYPLKNCFSHDVVVKNIFLFSTG